MTRPDTSAEFVTLWNAHSRRVYAYIYSLVADWAHADDIFQDTGLVVLKKFSEFEPGTNFGAWACRIAYHRVLYHLRQQRMQDHLDEEVLNALQDESLTMAEGLNSRLAALTECLKQLSEKDRKLVELRYHGSNAVETVAQKLGRTTWAVYKALTRIHETLLDCISRKLSQEEGP